jgi:ABC-type polysaccharide/polyol phosphate transport system ATPase subunit
MSELDRRSPVAIRCEGVSKCFLSANADPYHGLRRRLHDLMPFPRARERARPAGAVWALKDISFELPTGAVVGVLGGNGSGKSVLLKILARVTKPTSGRASVHGTVGSILHLGAMLLPDLTGRETIFQIGTLLRLPREVVKSRFDAIAAFADLGAQLDWSVRGYSAGMQLRLAFGVFVHLDSDILLLDEGLALADEEFRTRCLQRIRSMAAAGRTVVIVSHELDMLEALCDRILILNHGRLVANGDPGPAIREYRERMNYPDLMLSEM